MGSSRGRALEQQLPWGQAGGSGDGGRARVHRELRPGPTLQGALLIRALEVRPSRQ